MASHNVRLQEIKSLNRKANVRADVKRNNKNVLQEIRARRNEYDQQRKMEVLTKQNAKIL
jgi:hypothetical protein